MSSGQQATPNSLRDLYSSPHNGWAFVPSLSNPGPASSSSSAAAASSSLQWSTRSSTKPVFDLAPAYEESNINTRGVIKVLLATAFLQYTTTAIAMPWEVGKLLLQVQWVPKEEENAQGDNEKEQEQDDSSEGAESSEDDSYFHDPSGATTSPWRRARSKSRPADEQGYIVRNTMSDDGTRPSFVIPVGPPDGVWVMIKRIGNHRTEGWLSLWKGLLTACVRDFLESSLQPIVHNTLLPIAPNHSLLVPLTSHLLTGILLSPLDLLRTRQIIYPRTSAPSPLALFSQILREEGGLKGVYLQPHLLIPTILDNTIRPLISLSLPGIIHHYLGLRDDIHPIAYPIAEFIGACGALLITTPIETIRRRLQIQSRSGQPVPACVEVRPRPYAGVLDAFWKILTEERSGRPVGRKGGQKGKEALGGGENEEPEGILADTGVAQLYRGLGTGLAASGIVLVLALITGGESDGGWAEL